MSVDLSRVGERDRLKPQREPHWQRLQTGCYIGFRPSKRGGIGTWIARVYDREAGKNRLKALGDFPGLTGNETFGAAKKEAEAYASLVETGGQDTAVVLTVGDACREYARTRPEAESRFKRHVYDDPVARIRLMKLRRRNLLDWRERLEKSPALVTRRASGDHLYRQRALSTVNRDMAAFRAALAKVLAPGTPGSEAAWQEALRAARDARARRRSPMCASAIGGGRS